MAKKSVEVSSPSSSKASLAPVTHGISPFREFDRLIDRFFDHEWRHPLRWEQSLLDGLATAGPRIPKVDVIDRDAEVVLRAEVPGMAREDLEVSVTDSTVTIKGESHKEAKEESGDYYRCEMSHGSVARTVSLPCEVDANKAEARFKDGILELTLPKTKEAHRRTLKIQ
ncbi:Hsp20/alpha crystallin family protein [Halomonas binhaiensis]|uniref:Hsp20/alpha crystallin family protein n=1 Tax=Halomonas binhaiensis TaxID=2562282 RepID=A0A5C1NA44_9GAMM|nr:Hsp20/alpha crystallin family protein [Halomonas binhaiensis]QEM80276.1 Hsp20/alpha crystallin family protein [Halomonas binhaiensis]